MLVIIGYVVVIGSVLGGFVWHGGKLGVLVQPAELVIICGGAIGAFAIDAAGAWTFTANSAFDHLAVGQSVSEIFHVASIDGTPTAPISFKVRVTSASSSSFFQPVLLRSSSAGVAGTVHG